jgi:hypothetical protein
VRFHEADVIHSGFVGHIDCLGDETKVNFPVTRNKEGLVAARLEDLPQSVFQGVPLQLLLVDGELNYTGIRGFRELKNDGTLLIGCGLLGILRDARLFAFGVTGTISRNVTSNTRRTSISGVTLISAVFFPPGLKAMCHLLRI